MRVYLLIFVLLLSVCLMETCPGCQKLFKSVNRHKPRCTALLDLLGSGLKRRVEDAAEERIAKARRIEVDKAEEAERARLAEEERAHEEVSCPYYCRETL